MSKSGSPAPKDIISMPCAFSSAALLVTASVAEGLMLDNFFAIRGLLLMIENKKIKT